MRTIYLIRHGEPQFKDKRKYCIGRTDLPLSTMGQMQAALIGIAFKNIPINGMYSSPLKRSMQTASYISTDTVAFQGLEEINMGAWDGLPFDEIQKDYPDLYRNRGEDPLKYLPPGAESLETAQSRMLYTLDKLIKQTSGNIAIVAHAGVIRLLLAKLNGLPVKDFLSIPQPYGHVTMLQELNGGLIAPKMSFAPLPELQIEDCIALLYAAGTPQPVIKHSLAVSKCAYDIVYALSQIRLDRSLLIAASLLHDIARQESNHAQLGAQWMRSLGYESISKLIEVHHDLPESLAESISEASILFLADKLVAGSKRVTLEERFAKSRAKCATVKARLMHQKRYAQSVRLRTIMEQKMNSSIIKLDTV